MHSVAISPGLHALVTAAGSSAHLSGIPALPTSALPPTPTSAANSGLAAASGRPITGMSILQLASPHSLAAPGGHSHGSMLPPASPFIGSAAPPPSPALSSAAMAASGHTHAQAQLLALVAEGRERETRHLRHQQTRRDAAEEEDLNEEDDDESMADEDDQEQGEDDEDVDQSFDQDDDGDSHASQSCPPSPLASLALLSADAANGTSLGRRSANKNAMNLSARRRSVGSHTHATDHRAHSSERTSGLTLKRPKVSLTAAAPGFKKKAPAGEASSTGSAGGSSCHQCKSRRNYNDLTYCSSSLHKKNKNAVCRKKFCEHCLKKFYRELPHPSAGPSTTTMWSCPSCRKICCCAACRRREMRDEDQAGGGMHSQDNTPMPTPLYRGEHEQMHSHLQHGNMLMPSPSQPSSSPSPSALSMQRLLLSPTTSAMSPLPPNSSSHATKHTGSSLLQSRHGRVNTPPKRPFSTSPRSASLTSHSPPPLDNVGVNGYHTASNIASLTALSQAAMRSPHQTDGQSITISLQNHAPMHSSMHSLQHHQQTGSSLASSPVSSPNESHSRASSATSSHSLLHSIGTPKATATSLYSSLLLNGSNSTMLTPRMLPLSTLTGTAPGMSKSLLPQPLSLAATSDDSNDVKLEANDSNAQQSVLPSFALFYALGQLPAVQRDVTAVMSAQDGTANRDRLKRIESIFEKYAEAINNEELPLQI